MFISNEYRYFPVCHTNYMVAHLQLAFVNGCAFISFLKKWHWFLMAKSHCLLIRHGYGALWVRAGVLLWLYDIGGMAGAQLYSTDYLVGPLGATAVRCEWEQPRGCSNLWQGWTRSIGPRLGGHEGGILPLRLIPFRSCSTWSPVFCLVLVFCCCC